MAGVVLGSVTMLAVVVALALLGLWMLGTASTWVDRLLDRVAMIGFGRLVGSNLQRRRRIEAAYLETTYRNYAARTYLYAAMAFVVGTVLGTVLVATVVVFLEPVGRALAGLPGIVTGPLGLTEEFTFEYGLSAGLVAVVVLCAVVLGALSGLLAYGVRWWLPSSTAEVRRRGIDEGMTRTTAFMYALSRGGMEFPQILRTLTGHRQVYGETANEMSVAVREMDVFGRDMITALRRMSSRTPSEQFKTFTENLTSVLQSGQDLSEFLNDQFERFRRESEERQEDLLELLSTIAEAYVTVLVAGMLFFITILLIFGLTLSDTLTFLQIVVYVLIPAANAGFALLLQQQLSTFGISGVSGQSGVAALERRTLSTPTSVGPSDDGERTDGGQTANERGNRRTLALYDRLSRVRYAVRNPVEIVFWNPTAILWITLPIALGAFVLRVPTALAAEGINVRLFDDLFVQSFLFLIATYAVVRYVHKRHIRRIERATPEFLERLASLNEAGMSLVQAVERVRGTDLSVLGPEVDRIWRDMQYGSTVDDAFIRFGRRVRTKTLARVVTLLTNAMRASGDMGPVIRIAAEQHRTELSLRRQRRQQMFTYLVVIYISFFVFLIIILAVNELLVPNIPETSSTGDALGSVAGGGAGFAEFGNVDRTAYTLVFFHAALLQAVCAGFVAGQLGEGSLRDGAKHAAIMLAIAYLVFLLLSSPISSIVAGDVPGEEFQVTVEGDELSNLEEVSLSEGGFLAVYGGEEGINGTQLGSSEYLQPGSHSNIRIRLNETAWEAFKTREGLGTEGDDQVVLRLTAHKDSNGNERFDFRNPWLPGQSQEDAPYGTPTQGGQPGVEVLAGVDQGITTLG